MRFDTREQAGTALADELAGVVDGPCVVAGVPRGGMVVAVPVARAFEAPLCALHVRKLRAPFDAGIQRALRALEADLEDFDPEGVAFGAVDSDGGRVLDRTAVEALGLTDHEVESAITHARWELRLQEHSYSGPSLYPYLPDLPVVIVDDGMVSGLTLMAAVHQVRRHAGVQIVVAVPRATRSAADTLGGMVEGLVCPVITSEVRDIERFPEDILEVSEQAAWRAFKHQEIHVHETTAPLRRLQPVSRDDAATGRVLPGHAALAPNKGHPQRRNV